MVPGTGQRFRYCLFALKIIALTFACVASCLALAGPQFPQVSAKKLAVAPIVDGVISASEWSPAAYIDDFKDRVTAQTPKADRTFAYLGFTDKGIYCAFVCEDSEPEKIIGREVVPNAEFRGEDTVTLDLNLFGTRAYDQLNEFIVNAIGTQTERIAGGRASKREWRGEWQAKTRKTDRGWECEMFVPWKMLNYPDRKSINMDLNLIRRIGRTQYEQSWANCRTNPLPELQGQWLDVQPPAPPKPKTQFLVYDAIDLEGESLHNRTGFDARIPLTQTFNGLVTVAPDFQNIEDVIAGNDFVRTERFLSDPRPFFVEGNQFFELNDRFTFGRLFYSRRINQLDIGAKTYGQLNPKLALGALLAKSTDGGSSAVVKLNNTISGTQNQRVYAVSDNRNGKTNTAIGAAFFKRWDTIGFSGELTSEQNQGEDADTAGSFQLSYQRPNTRLNARYTWVESDFAPSLGFVPWQNRRGGNAFLEVFRNYRSGSVRDTYLNIFYEQYRTYDTDVVQQGGFSIYGELSSFKDIGFGVSYSRQTFSGSLDEVLGYNLTFGKTNRFRQISLGYDRGTRQDQPSSYYSLGSSWRVANGLDIGIRQSVLELGGSDRQSIFTAQYQLASDQLISTRTVILNGSSNTYFSYRKAGLAGAEYYLIYGDPNAPTSQNRLSIKAVWAF